MSIPTPYTSKALGFLAILGLLGIAVAAAAGGAWALMLAVSDVLAENPEL